MSENTNTYKDLFTPAAILVAGGMISLSILSGGSLPTVPSQGLPAQVGELTNVLDNTGATAPVVTEDDHIRGNPSAPITIVEYSDFECPFCRQFHPTVQQAMEEYGDQIRWVYRHFPLTQIHPNAQPAAEASECVAEQKGSDGFWQFADAMFADQARLGTAFYREVAGQIGVNLAQYDTCVSSRKYEEKVTSQQAEGVRLGITGTPGSFVNDTPVRGALPYENIKTIIEAELQKL